MILCFGGTFDPIHLGHVAAAQAAVAAVGAPSIRLILSARPSHRGATGANVAQRLRMLELACAEHPEFIVDDREVRRDAPSYTVDTLTEIRAEFPGQPVYWVIGADAYHYLPSWSRWEQVFELAHLLVMQRVGYGQPPEKYAAALEAATSHRLCALPPQGLTRQREGLTPQETGLTDAAAGVVYELPVRLPDISATNIRKRVASGYPVAHLMPKSLAGYLREQGLYQLSNGETA